MVRARKSSFSPDHATWQCQLLTPLQLLLSLLRFNHVVAGTIVYDGVDITALPRKKLRQAITTVPQEAILFQGSIRSNLDPAQETEPSQLQKVLGLIKSLPAMRSSDSNSPSEPQADWSSGEPAAGTATSMSELSLNTPVQAGGSNFSHGQRQILSLCRALVRDSKLVLLDEATSNMDDLTDKSIQQILRTALGGTPTDRCLVTIAHRLSTVTDYDKVVVMGSGRILEVGSPEELMAKEGVFYEMVQHGGTVDVFP